MHAHTHTHVLKTNDCLSWLWCAPPPVSAFVSHAIFHEGWDRFLKANGGPLEKLFTTNSNPTVTDMLPKDDCFEVLQRVAVCCVAVRCNVLQCVIVCCHVLPCVAVCCSSKDDCLDVLQCVVLQCAAVRCSALQCVAVRCRVLQQQRRLLRGVTARCSVLQCVAVYCSVLQCIAVCCSVLQCVAAVRATANIPPSLMPSCCISLCCMSLLSLFPFT